jgi:hypothetical protein
LRGDRRAEPWHEFGEGQLERVESELERAGLGELVVEVDEALGEPLVPELAVDVVDLVEGEHVAVVEDALVVGGEGGVDAAAEEHRPGSGEALALEVVAAPVVGFCAPRAPHFPC